MSEYTTEEYTLLRDRLEREQRVADAWPEGFGVKSVWIIEGWFGDVEWYEPHAYPSKEAALEAMASLAESRTSDRGPSYAKGLHKFALAEVPLVGGPEGKS